MNEQDIQEEIQDRREFINTIIDSREKVLAFLESTGIYDSEGNLTEPYQSK